MIMPFVFLILSSLTAWAADPMPWPQQLSADQVLTMADGKSMTSQIYIDHDKIRVNANVSGMEMSTIILSDQKRMYMIMPAQKRVMEMPMQTQDADQMPSFTASSLHYEKVGTDTINGIACEKYLLGAAGGHQQFFWVNQHTRLPVRVKTTDGSVTIDWKNVVVGPQPSALFVPPADYTRTQMPAMPKP